MPWAEDKIRLEKMTEEQRAQYYENRRQRQREAYHNSPNRRAAMDRKNELRKQRRRAELEKQEREAPARPSRSKHGAAALEAWLKEGEPIRGYSAFLQSKECVKAAQLNVSRDVA